MPGRELGEHLKTAVFFCTNPLAREWRLHILSCRFSAIDFPGSVTPLRPLAVMQSLLYSLGGLSVVGLTMLIHATLTAPEGVEDERGFHLLDGGAFAKSIPEPFILRAGDVLFFK